MRFLLTFILLFAFIPQVQASKLARFTLDSSNIASWKDNRDSFSIELTQQGSHDLRDFTQNNLNKQVELYVGVVLVMSPVVRDAIAHGKVLLAVDENLHDQILSFLPPDRVVDPDPVQENFGTRLAPYAGFLVLPPAAVPPGFKETKHHYTKRNYSVSFTKMVNGKQINLDIMEDDRAVLDHTGSILVNEFEHQGITGQVYTHHHKITQEDSIHLIWLNPPKQRIAIYLTQTPDHEYTPETLIDILKSMRPAL